MGRRPTKHLNLPPRLRARTLPSGRTYYYYDTGGKPRHELPLGSDYALAVKKWAELEIDARQQPDQVATFRLAAERYMREVLPTKAPRTQKDNLAELRQLYKFFDQPPAPLDEITPQHIRQYLDRRKGSAVRANREKALFSHIFNKAREWGYTTAPNPATGVRGFTERGRDVYIEDETFAAVWDAADWPTRDAMDLAYLTGQRPADVLKMRLTDIHDGLLWLTQGKTRKKLRIAVEGELATLITRINARSHQVTSLHLIRDEKGNALSHNALDNRFENARARAVKALNEAGKHEAAAAARRFQFRDLRAKAGTDKADATDIRQAQHQLGHDSVKMTESYVRSRAGAKVTPTK